MEWCGGIASSAAAIVAAARRGHPDAMVAGTRKNVPGNRCLAVKALQNRINRRESRERSRFRFRFRPGCTAGT
jgi:hypothetical protein